MFRSTRLYWKGLNPHVFDIHCHLLSAATKSWLAGRPYARVEGEWVKVGSRRLPLPSLLGDARACMERLGPGGRALVSPPPALYLYEIEDEAPEFARRLNSDLVELATPEPGVGVLIWLPLQDVATSLEEIDRLAGEAAVMGVVSGSDLTDGRLSSQHLDPVWAALNECGLSLFIHANGNPVVDPIPVPRVGPALGFPIDVAVSAIDLIFSDSSIWERGPNVCFSHGGGILALLLPRILKVLDDIQRAVIEQRLEQIWVDGVVFGEDSRQLISSTFRDRILPGSDWPFELAVETEEMMWPRPSREMSFQIMDAFPRAAAGWPENENEGGLPR